VDHLHPLEALIPGARGRILEALVTNTGPQSNPGVAKPSRRERQPCWGGPRGPGRVRAGGASRRRWPDPGPSHAGQRCRQIPGSCA